MSELSLRQGELLVKLARKAVESYFSNESLKPPSEKWLEEKRGVFVTINTYPSDELRGCIGFPLPIYPLKKAVVEAAISAAFSDPRFPPLKKEELQSVVFEVSVLSVPKEIKFKDEKELLNKIEPHKDGLILELGQYKGLFLPQVWEQIPDKVSFLSHLCLKAGIYDVDCWKKKNIKIYKFRAQIFKEEKPNGKIIQCS